MGRFPRLRFDMADLGPIHGVYLSHAHSDHLDPYTLVRLWGELEDPPALLLPVSLAFLLPIFQEHLHDPDVRVLEPHVAVPFRGVEVLGFFDVGPDPTNEEDVMVLVVLNGAELVLVEADARLSLQMPGFRDYISQFFRAPGIESAVFLTTENELTGTLEGRSCSSTEARQDLVDRAVNEMLEAVQELYEPVEDPNDLWHGAHVLRLVHGQGLTAPHELDPRWQRILFPVRIEDRVREERAAAERSGFAHGIDSLTVGLVHTIVAGRVRSTEPMLGLALLDDEANRTFDERSDFFPELPCAPLRLGERDVQRQRARIAELLDGRFLPYLHGLRMPPVLHLLGGYGGVYRVRVHFGSTVDELALDYVLGYGARGFVEVELSGEEAHEAYWANDLEDFLDGTCDEFSPFCRTQLPVPEMRLWACLATPLLHSDLVAKRVALHFERARDGLTAGSFVKGRFAEWPDGPQGADLEDDVQGSS